MRIPGALAMQDIPATAVDPLVVWIAAGALFGLLAFLIVVIIAWGAGVGPSPSLGEVEDHEHHAHEHEAAASAETASQGDHAPAH